MAGYTVTPEQTAQLADWLHEASYDHSDSPTGNGHDCAICSRRAVALVPIIQALTRGGWERE